MGCCSPNNYEHAAEKEAEVNESGMTKVPLLVKAVSLGIVITAISLYFL
ncbi:hypothetical protein [Thalassobacillus hwangdonensis]|uniref:Uncharacterized protein n=1 Tax=Thalassobacillus hwangdonensis TaxID=546108 RepID=A0ABW3L3J6_9BACI